MAVCKFWQQGNCRNGAGCRFEHSDQNANYNKNGFNNRYAPLQNQTSNQSNSRNYNTQRGGEFTRVHDCTLWLTTFEGNEAHVPFSLDKASIKQDLSTDRPQWILSAYGPGRHAPEQLFGGPAREQSFEEMRLIHYIAAASGNVQPVIQDAERLWQEAEQQIQNALNDVDGAINYIIAADNKHPNRNDYCQQNTSTDQTPWVQRNDQPAGNSAFGAPSQTLTSTFGQPSTQSSSAFAQPIQNVTAFGQPSNQNSSAFGGTAQGFGAVQQGGASGGFGQPSALGQKPSVFGSAFGQPSQLEQGGGAFGNPSATGPKANPFGAPSNSGMNCEQSGFSNFGGTSNAFGQPNPNPLGNAFSSDTLRPGTQQSQINPMSQDNNPLAPVNSFGQPALSNPFGANSGNNQAFGAPPASTNPFGAPSPQPTNVMQNQFTNPGSQTQQFGNNQNFENLNMIAGVPSARRGSNMNTFSPNFRPPPNANIVQHPPPESYIRTGQGGRLEFFNGRPVMYKDGEPGTNINGKWHKIWCPKGYTGPNKTTEIENAVFDEQTTAAYLGARQTGTFPGGVMPLIPPKREWCLFNF
ncbi:hypothetical protein sscle_12g089030 [Sclerotinia sclerotiorum 1980 UF-70]|uniref:C3H1-type domain-containing protein n=1 Tax=Sclerotinia sclerotiorum (strain ATCC 18683 / 1980 / Ss-1) TaxID=665079 RepID=A0A1D9QHP4_SCLS1|nr:hypothetical protein sscle_12g089030 [Sclerotinia sclerotiorum 1980 UF-70]